MEESGDADMAVVPSSPLSSPPDTSPPESICNDEPQSQNDPVMDQNDEQRKSISQASRSQEPAPSPIWEEMLRIEEEQRKAKSQEPQTQEEEDAGPEEDQEAQDSIVAKFNGSYDEPEPKRRKVAIRKPPPKVKLRTSATPRKTAKDKKWEAPFVYTDEKSPLTQADLRAILLLPEAWDILTEEERKEILQKFPDETHIMDAGTPDARPNTGSLRNDDDFRHDCARYTENIELGKHDEDWLYQAWTAHEKHKRGDFDDFLRKTFEDEWDVKLPKQPKLQRASEQSREGSVSNHQETSSGDPMEVDQERPPSTSHHHTDQTMKDLPVKEKANGDVEPTNRTISISKKPDTINVNTPASVSIKNTPAPQPDVAAKENAKPAKANGQVAADDAEGMDIANKTSSEPTIEPHIAVNGS